MSVIFLLITASTFVAGVFLVAFIWAVRKGQFDDDVSPAVRILNEPSASRPGSPSDGLPTTTDRSATPVQQRPFTIVH